MFSTVNKILLPYFIAIYYHKEESVNWKAKIQHFNIILMIVAQKQYGQHINAPFRILPYLHYNAIISIVL